jgi:hypothetical protein
MLRSRMTKSRMRNKSGDGLWTVHALVHQFSERLSSYASAPTLSEVFVEVLNGDTLTGASKRRVKRIVELLRFQKSYESQVMARLRDDVMADLYVDALLKCNFELNEMLLRYKVTPQIHPGAVAPTLFFLSAESSGDSPQETAEVGAVMCGLQLTEHNQIDNVRECSCGAFFVAGRIDQYHCSAKCRVKAHQSSEEFKAKRREADRERYRLHRDGRVKQPNGRKSNGTQKTR